MVLVGVKSKGGGLLVSCIIVNGIHVDFPRMASANASLSPTCANILVRPFGNVIRSEPINQCERSAG